ncbi:MAG: phosphonoacetaldehyde reductase [Defluviitoga tunisiensis]
MRQIEYIGYNSTEKIIHIIEKENIKKPFLVISESAFKGSKLEEIIRGLLKVGKIEGIYIFSDFENNPKYEDIIKGLELFKKNRHDVIISYGGGSSIDVSKLIKYFSCIDNKNNREGNLLQIKGENYNRAMQKDIIHIAIPTTCGSGAEATKFAVMYYQNKKYSVEHQALLPKYVIIDPYVFMKLPDKILASSIMDSLAQGIESYWSINSTEESQVYSKKCIGLVMQNYLKAFEERDINSLYNLSKASNFSGKAINIAKTTAPHAMSYVLTNKYNIPHGQAVMMILPYVYEFNAEMEGELKEKRGKDYLRKVFEELNSLLNITSSKEIKEKLINMMTALNLETKLSEITPEEINVEELVNSINLERLNNNPLKINKTEIETIYNCII